MTAVPSPRSESRRLVPSRAWAVVLAAYLVLYGAFLLATDGFPYTIDNNESFSSLVHAKNLAQFDLGKSYGLTDESYALTEAGHPYIHSHQGNFPRLFAFLLYLLGARSVESQIWLTTFTVGLAAIGLAFRFGQRLGGPWLGALACLLLMTDYVLFAQWQVNTYRVWHAFFFFSSLECVHLAAARRRGLAWLVVAANFAALFYWEYVFGAFIGLMTGLYALCVHGRSWRQLWHSWAGIIAGGLVAATTLLAQLTAYMGWANVLRDIRYTVLARNSASDAAFAAEVNEFYDRHHILFWQNYVDASPLKSWTAAWQGVLDHHWHYSSPILVALTLLVLGAWAFSSLSVLDPVRSRTAAASPKLRLWLATLAKFLLLMLAVWPGIAATELLAGVPLAADATGRMVLVVLLPLALSGLWFRNLFGLVRIGWLRLLGAWGYSSLTLALLSSWTALQRAGGASPLLAATGPLQGSWFAVLSVGTVLVFVLSLLVLGPAQVLGRGSRRLLGRTAQFLVAVTGAFIPVYFVFAGYIYSGYLYRQAPFLVFATDLLMAVALMALVLATLRMMRRGAGDCATMRAVWRIRGQRRAAVSAGILRCLPCLGLAATLALLIVGWGSLQAHLWQAAPPTNYRFLAQLKAKPYRGASFAVNTYAAPVAVNTRSWAYFESTLFSGTLELGRNGWITPRDHQYLWFADRLTNREYRHPAYALSIVQPAGMAESLQRSAEPAGRPAEASGLFRRAQESFQPFLRHRVVSSDGRHHSIVRLDWDYPAYLRPQETQIRDLAQQLSLDQKLALSAEARKTARRWRVELDFLDTNPTARAGLELTRDGVPVAFAHDTASGPLIAVVIADHLRLHVPRSPAGGRMRITVNDATETIDRAALADADTVFEWSAAQPHGRFTRLPSFTPGFYVQTRLHHQAGRPVAELNYRYAHQEGAPEAATTVRLYEEAPDGRWRVAETVTFLGSPGVPVDLAGFRRDNPETITAHQASATRGDPRTYEQWLADHLAAHPDEWTRPGIIREALPSAPAETFSTDAPVVRRMPLPVGSTGRLQFSVTPGTRTKAGPEYFGLPFFMSAFGPDAGATVAFTAPAASRDPRDLPFGRLRLKLRFPPDRWPQSEPIVTTGSNEAGDIVYVIYDDPGHIRLGFDHWFKGGPITKPIPIDFTREHELEISVGSLYPSTEDIVFIGRPAAAVAAVKNRVVIKLDGQTVIDGEASCYDSSPDQVTLGRNTINGTSAGPVFTGKILSVERVWPWPE